jgi:hypothetical protein
MLAGFEDVERLVVLEGGRAQTPPGDAATAPTDLAAILTRQVAQLDPLVTPRQIALDWTPPDAPLLIALPAAEAERLVWRVLATLTGAAAPGERLSLALRDHGQCARLDLTLPQSLAQRDDDALFAPDIARGHAVGLLGHGFALRLASAELRSAGGQMDRAGPVLNMTLPLTRPHRLDRDLAAS